uniref:Uncharacterized protein n=1 Tax=Arundo donax TaxID=35708 RepID=A0A0A8ZIM9_ARUDO
MREWDCLGLFEEQFRAAGDVFLQGFGYTTLEIPLFLNA